MMGNRCVTPLFRLSLELHGHILDMYVQIGSHFDIPVCGAFLCRGSQSRLLGRVHEVIKQCRDLKTDNGQKERRIDELLEENGTLATQVRFSFFHQAVFIL